MSDNPFGANSIDQHSLPSEVQKLRFGTLFHMNPRQNDAKPGRVMSIVWDERKPLLPDFHNGYSYFVTFTEIGNIAGNHYHTKKQEIYFPVVGQMTVILQNIETKKTEEIILKAEDHRALLVPAGVGHVVRSDTNPAVLLVTTNSATEDSDYFEWQIL